MPGVGDPVPDFNLKDHTGSEATAGCLPKGKKQMVVVACGSFGGYWSMRFDDCEIL